VLLVLVVVVVMVMSGSDSGCSSSLHTKILVDKEKIKKKNILAGSRHASQVRLVLMMVMVCGDGVGNRSSLFQ
jgi:hypothetical protein